MRYRPLCIVFFSMILVILICKAAGLPLWGSPVFSRELRQKAEGGTVSLTGTLHRREEKTNSTAYILSDSSFDSVYLHNVSLYFSKETPAFPAGTTITVTGNLEWYAPASNPGGFDAAAYYAAEKCYTRMYVQEYTIVRPAGFSPEEGMLCLRETLDRNLHRLMQEEQASVLSALLLGERSGLREEIRLDYSAAGLGHVLAISGFHVHLFGMALYRLLMKLRCRVKLSAALVMAFLALYTAFTGGSSSTIRAAVMFGTALLGRSLLRSYDPFSALSLSGCMILFFRPAMLFQAGFQLSYAAALAISAMYPVLMKSLKSSRTHPKSVKHSIRVYLKNAVLLWLSVNAFTFPLILYHFYEFPLYALFSNLFLLPLMSLIMITGSVGVLVSLFCPAAAGVLLMLPQWMLQLVSFAGNQIRKLPMAMIVTGKPGIPQLLCALAGVILLMVLLYRHARFRFCMIPALLILLCAFRLPQGFSLTVLDVGQGDCIVLRTAQGSVFLIDAGSTSEDGVAGYILLPYLKEEGITRIDGIFLTHADRDHDSGIEELLERMLQGKTAVQAGRLIMPYWMKDEEKAEHILQLAKEAQIPVAYADSGDEISDGLTEIKVLGPKKGDGLTGNAGSLVLLVRYGSFDALLTGDLEGEGEEEILPHLTDVDVLKVAHHGSASATGEAFLEITKPEACLISAPKHSIYGHPHRETIERIEQCGADWYQTGLCGAIRVSVGKDSMQIDCFCPEDKLY